jgi:hypothetical protein
VTAVRADPDDADLRRYLLGLLPDAEAEALEDAYFASPDVLERVRGVEDDLLDDHAAGRLEPRERKAFDTRYLASGPLRQRVAAARALRLTAADAGRPAARPVGRAVPWKIPLAIAAGLLVAVLAFWVRPLRPPEVASAIPPLASGSEAPVPPSAALSEPSRAPLPTPPVPRTPSRPLVLALSPVLLRGADGPAELRVSQEAETVVLELEGDPGSLPRPATALQVDIKTVEGTEVWRGEARRAKDARRPSLLASAHVPAARLPAGDYLVTLSVPAESGATLHRYFFRIAR